MISLNNVNFSYTMNSALFSKLNLKIHEGNICGLLGKNGAGKTTLFKILSGLIFPKEGTCEVLGFIPKKRFANFLSNIYFVPEEFYLPHITINQYINFCSPFYRKFDNKFFLHCLNEFGLSKDKKVINFSYGEKKKFLLSFALSSGCDLILLDEPTNGLDIPSKSQFLRLLTTAINERRTIIISTHQVSEIEYLIDPIIIIDNGEIVFNQSIEKISKKLIFTNINKEISEDLSRALFVEKTFKGYKVVLPRKDDFESEVDIEMLFNAVIANREKISSLF